MPGGHFGVSTGAQTRPFQKLPSGQQLPFGIFCGVGQATGSTGLQRPAGSIAVADATSSSGLRFSGPTGGSFRVAVLGSRQPFWRIVSSGVTTLRLKVALAPGAIEPGFITQAESELFCPQIQPGAEAEMAAVPYCATSRKPIGDETGPEPVLVTLMA
jgi:hypothetical protein